MSKVDDMIIRNLNLVPYVIKKLGLGDKYEDYVDVGWIGLVVGCKTFDDTRGIEESTYLYKCIKTYICNQIKHESFYVNSYISFDYEVDDDVFYNIVPSDYDVFSEVKIKMIQDEMRNVIKYDMYNQKKTLDHAEIAAYLFGIDVNPMSNKELCEKYKISAEMIQHIKRKFRKHLRKRLKLVLD